jgi:hypothetical protein
MRSSSAAEPTRPARVRTRSSSTAAVSAGSVAVVRRAAPDVRTGASATAASDTGCSNARSSSSGNESAAPRGTPRVVMTGRGAPSWRVAPASCISSRRAWAGRGSASAAAASAARSSAGAARTRPPTSATPAVGSSAPRRERIAAECGRVGASQLGMPDTSTAPSEAGLAATKKLPQQLHDLEQREEAAPEQDPVVRPGQARPGQARPGHARLVRDQENTARQHGLSAGDVKLHVEDGQSGDRKTPRAETERARVVRTDGAQRDAELVAAGRQHWPRQDAPCAARVGRRGLSRLRLLGVSSRCCGRRAP